MDDGISGRRSLLAGFASHLPILVIGPFSPFFPTHLLPLFSSCPALLPAAALAWLALVHPSLRLPPPPFKD